MNLQLCWHPYLPIRGNLSAMRLAFEAVEVPEGVAQTLVCTDPELPPHLQGADGCIPLELLS